MSAASTTEGVNHSAQQSRFDVRRTADGCYELSEELRLTTAEALDTVLQREPAAELTFDVARLDFLDSSGMRVLLRGRSSVGGP